MKSCNRKILELFYNAKHAGRISKPEASARFGENDEGLVIELTWRVIDGVIADAKFRAFGNPNAIAITSLMVDNIIGKSIDDALLINEDVIIDNLEEFRPEYLEVYDVVRACIMEAYENYQKRENKTTRVYTDKDYYHEEEIVDESISVAKQIQRELQGEVVITETRGRGRPRRVVEESEVSQIGEKRGRGRPRKEVDPNEVVEIGEKRGRGRPRKEVDPNEVIEVGEKRGRGRPRKEIKFNIPTDLDEVEYDKDMEELINGSSHTQTEIYEQSKQQISGSKLIDEDDDTFDADYDLFKSNIRNIFSGKEVSSKTYGSKSDTVTEVKPLVEQKAVEVETVKVEPVKSEPIKIIVEEEDLQEKRGRGRPRKEEPIPNPHAKSSVNAVSSITRSLTPNSMPLHSSQDIIFASKNVTTTNININVTKTMIY